MVNKESAEEVESINDWRRELKLNEPNNIRVALPWAHDEEIRCASMFPDFLCVDMAFGVNKEQRDIFLAAEIDGNMKTYTAFRVFMPSK